MPSEIESLSAFDLALSLNPNIPITTAADIVKAWGEAQREAGRQEALARLRRLKDAHIANSEFGDAAALRAVEIDFVNKLIDAPAPEPGVEPLPKLKLNGPVDDLQEIIREAKGEPPASESLTEILDVLRADLDSHMEHYLRTAAAVARIKRRAADVD